MKLIVDPEMVSCMQVVVNIPFYISRDVIELLFLMGDIFLEVILLFHVRI